MVLRYEGLYSQEIQSIDFATSMIGTAVGTNGIFLRTVNMGQNWNQVANIPEYNYSCICFPGPVIGYALAGSKLLKTTNTGMTWTEQDIPTINPIEDICVTSSYNVYACAMDAQLFGLVNDTSTVGIHEFTGPDIDFKSYSYPNPSDITTTICYTLTENADVLFRIFTINGQEIFSADQSRQSPGT